MFKDLNAINNAFKHPDICHFVKFDDLMTNPTEELQKIYKFLEEPYYPHKFQNLKQININDIEYDDTVVGKNMHTIRTIVKKEENNYIVPNSIRERYGHIKI